MITPHKPNCRWEKLKVSECPWRNTHEYCPHENHACDCRQTLGSANTGEREFITPHGFIEPEITSDHWVLGSALQIAGVKHMPGGHGWGKFLPPDELQNRNGLETYNCTNYGTNNAWETLAKKVLGIAFNFSERYTGVGTGTSQGGNNPHDVAEIIRKEIGQINEEDLPFGNDIDTWEKYYSPKPMREDLLAKGKKFLTQYKLGHDWVFVGGSLAEKQEKMKEALEYSPLGASVLAWKERNGKYFKKIGERDNHWVEVYDFEEGVCWMVFDHYDNTHKKLEWNYDFGYAKRYSIEKLATPAEEPKRKTALQRFFEWLAQLVTTDYALEK